MEASSEGHWPSGSGRAQERDFPYFRRLWMNIVVALLGASFIPMIVIGGGMYYYTVSIIREKTLDSLRQEMSEHREAVDEFLSERTMDLKLLAANLGPEHLTGPGAIEKAFRSLQAGIPCFTDLGVIDQQGRHLAYVGPYDLMAQNYKETAWFKALREKDTHISDVFAGFRKEPHVIIAVKQATEDGFWILRATVDAAYFDKLVTGVLSHRRGDAFLVNRGGLFQSNPKAGGKLMEHSGLKDLEPFDDVDLQEKGEEIVAMAWLQTAPWAIVGKFDSQEIYGPLKKVRYLAIYVFVLGGILIVGTVLLTTNALILRLERKRRSIRVLDQKLQHSSRMSSSMNLAPGIVQEMNDTLSNIDLVSSWVQDLSHRNLGKEENLLELRESVRQIKQEVARARKTTEKLVKATRRNIPVIREIDMNALLEEILELLDRELRFNGIKVERNFEKSLPTIRSDPSLVRQVFQNLILNAVTAIRRDGRITLTTCGWEGGVTVDVADTGPGIPEEIKSRIFDPLYTARPDGSGFGLSIGASILQKLGGRISVRSEPGKGAMFTVELPSSFASERKK
jgi:two-component system, NtrC family, sensor kinase